MRDPESQSLTPDRESENRSRDSGFDSGYAIWDWDSRFGIRGSAIRDEGLLDRPVVDRLSRYFLLGFGRPPAAHVECVRHDARARLERLQLRHQLQVQRRQQIERHHRRLAELPPEATLVQLLHLLRDP